MQSLNRVQQITAWKLKTPIIIGIVIIVVVVVVVVYNNRTAEVAVQSCDCLYHS